LERRGEAFFVVDPAALREELGLAGEVAVGSGLPAAVSNARRNCSGSSFPRFSARRKIPAQAFGLK
jgi:hypothetical protein